MGRRMLCPRCTLRHSPWCEGPRWPLQPLLDQLGGKPALGTFRCSGTELAKAAEFGLSDVMADRWAIRARLHPAMVWGLDWFDAGLRAHDAVFVAQGWRHGWLHGEEEQMSTYRDEEKVA